MNPILIPVHNGLWMTKGAVRTALAQDIGDVEVLLVNDGSDDGTVQWAALQPVRVISYAPRVPSVAYAWNRGLETLFAEGAPHVLVCNNDIELRTDVYRLLVADPHPFITGVGVFPDEWESRRDAPLTVDGTYRPHPAFSCFLLRREVWEKVGEFDEVYLRGYVEDAAYHVRMHRAGVVAGSIGVPFLHYASGTANEMTEAEQQALQTQATRNRTHFRETYGFDVGSPEYYRSFGNDAP